MRAAGLTRQLLAFSRKQIIEPTLLDLNVVVADMQAMLRTAHRGGRDGRARLQAELALVIADRGQVEQIVMNLAVNARDAMPEGGTLTIETANVELDEHYAATHADGQAWRLRGADGHRYGHRDDAGGAGPPVRAVLHDQGRRQGHRARPGDRPRHRHRAAAGASTSTAKSARARRSRCIFRGRTPARHRRPAPPPAPRRTGAETVLVVEDADGCASWPSRLLQRQGYTVLAAANADEALRLFDAARVDRRAPDRRRHAGRQRAGVDQAAGRATAGAEGDLHVRLHRGRHRPPRRAQSRDRVPAQAVHLRGARTENPRGAGSVAVPAERRRRPGTSQRHRAPTGW